MFISGAAAAAGGGGGGGAIHSVNNHCDRQCL